MTNHAVLTVWTLDNHNFDPAERDKLLTEEVVPRVSALPGFVEGRWNRSSDGVRAYNTVVSTIRQRPRGSSGMSVVTCQQRPRRGCICTPWSSSTSSGAPDPP
jgi:hypothetical protein